MALELTFTNFNAQVLFSKKFCMVEFWGKWCGPCKQMAPIIDELAQEYAGKVMVGKVDVDESSEIANTYEIKSIPSILFFRNGKIVYEHIGIISKDNLDKDVQEYLGSPDKIQEYLKPRHFKRQDPFGPNTQFLPG